MALASRLAAFILRVHLAIVALGVGACVSACATRDDAAVSKPAAGERVSGAAEASAPVSLEGWQAETFPLPPGFAPELPSGTESLRFSPGWRDPNAAGFWSYAFVMWIDEAAPDGARIDELLEKYYNGLMGAFAAGAGQDISGTPARVDVVRTAPGRYEARMHLIDAFATFKPIELRVLVDVVGEDDGHSTLRIRVSPRAKGDAIWRALDAAIAGILASRADPSR